VRKRGWNRLANRWDTLTAAKRRVAEFVAQRLTNREVADRLFTSPSTVATQLTAPFRTLEITSRVVLEPLSKRY